MASVTRGVGFVSVGVSKRIPLSVLAQNTQRSCVRDSPRDLKKMWEGKVPRQNREKPMIRERRLLGPKEWQLLGPVDTEAGLANVRKPVNVHGGCVGISRKYMSVIAYRNTESYTKANLIRVCLFSFLPPSRLCMLCFVCP